MTATAALGVEGLAVTGAIVVVALAYGRALEGPGPRVPLHHAAALYTGLVVIGVALVGPLEQAAHTSFSAHMAQHLLLGVVAPPLLLAGRVPGVLARRGRRSLRVRTGRWYGRALRMGRGRAWLPVAAVAASAAVWWGWHVPAAYTAALQSPLVHAAEHLTMVVAGLALWAPVLRPRATPRWMGPLLLLGALIHSGILAALLTFAPRPLYPALGGADGAGVAALADQQMGGAMMWVVGGLVYVTAAAVSIARALGRDEQEQRRRSRAEVAGAR